MKKWWIAKLKTTHGTMQPCPSCQTYIKNGQPVAFAGKFSRDAVWLCVPCAHFKNLPLTYAREVIRRAS